MSCRCGTTWTGHRIEHCPSCCQTFTGTSAGDMHRTGEHHISVGPDRRRCLTEAEMLEKGMAKNGRGHWMTRPTTPQNAPPQRPRSDEGDRPGAIAPGGGSDPLESEFAISDRREQ